MLKEPARQEDFHRIVIFFFSPEAFEMVIPHDPVIVASPFLLPTIGFTSHLHYPISSPN